MWLSTQFHFNADNCNTEWPLGDPIAATSSGVIFQSPAIIFSCEVALSSVSSFTVPGNKLLAVLNNRRSTTKGSNAARPLSCASVLVSNHHKSGSVVVLLSSYAFQGSGAADKLWPVSYLSGFISFDHPSRSISLRANVVPVRLLALVSFKCRQRILLCYCMDLTDYDVASTLT